jgi:hypothetical protein
MLGVSAKEVTGAPLLPMALPMSLASSESEPNTLIPIMSVPAGVIDIESSSTTIIGMDSRDGLQLRWRRDRRW